MGLTALRGEVQPLATGTALVGKVTLRWIGLVSNALCVLLTIATLVLAVTIGWGQVIGGALFWTVGWSYAMFVQRRDRRLLLEVLGDLVVRSAPVM